MEFGSQLINDNYPDSKLHSKRKSIRANNETISDMDASAQQLWNINFISEIEKRPGIWNSSLMSRPLQKQLWEELSELNNKPGQLICKFLSTQLLQFYIF